MRVLIVLILGAWTATIAWANPTPEAAVEAYLQANRSHKTELLQRAFHATAMMYWLDENQRLQGMTQYAWKARMRLAPPAAQFQQKLSTIDRHGQGAVAVISAEREGRAIVDFLLLLQTQEGWRCVGKVYGDARADQTQNTAEFAQAAAALVAKKQLSDASWNARMFRSTQHLRAMVFNLDEGELVAASASEWAARFAERKHEKLTVHPTGFQINALQGTHNVGYVRWTIQWSDQSRWTDFALLVKADGRWQMINLAFVQA
jgi:hypothetical protein